jgi:hypothetical protein
MAGRSGYGNMATTTLVGLALTITLAEVVVIWTLGQRPST